MIPIALASVAGSGDCGGGGGVGGISVDALVPNKAATLLPCALTPLQVLQLLLPTARWRTTSTGLTALSALAERWTTTPPLLMLWIRWLPLSRGAASVAHGSG
jgi:hypothetical protein